MKELAYYEINHSKFYGYIFDIKSVEEFNEILEAIKKEHKKATHFVYCYKLYGNNEMLFKRDDDVEPKGFATTPMVNLIEKHNLNQIGIIVVRYFGKAKLGGHKLVQSYNKTVNLAYQQYLINKEIK